MRAEAKDTAQLNANMRWIMERHLQVIEDIASSPEVSATGRPDIAEANERYVLSVALGDSEAEDAAIVDLIRAGMMEWWPRFSERQLLRDLFRRAARQRAGSDSKDISRPPTHGEGLRVAKALLAEVGGNGRLDTRREALQVSAFLHITG